MIGSNYVEVNQCICKLSMRFPQDQTRGLQPNGGERENCTIINYYSDRAQLHDKSCDSLYHPLCEANVVEEAPQKPDELLLNCKAHH